MGIVYRCMVVGLFECAWPAPKTTQTPGAPQVQVRFPLGPHSIGRMVKNRPQRDAGGRRVHAALCPRLPFAEAVSLSYLAASRVTSSWRLA